MIHRLEGLLNRYLFLGLLSKYLAEPFLKNYSNEKGKLDYVIDLIPKSSNLDINFYIDDF